jgi:hypothetical protein
MSTIHGAYQCGCSRYCKYLKNVSKATFYNHTKYRHQDRYRLSNARRLLFVAHVLTASRCTVVYFQLLMHITLGQTLDNLHA